MTYILDTVYFIRLDQVYYVFLSLDLVHNGHILMSAPVLRIQDVYPGSRILNFPHPGTQISDPGSKNSNKREGWKKICCHNFLCSHKFHKIAHYFSFEVPKKKIWANFQWIIGLFTQKLSISSQKYGFGIRDPEKTYSGSRIQGSKGTGSRIRIRNTGI